MPWVDSDRGSRISARFCYSPRIVRMNPDEFRQLALAEMPALYRLALYLSNRSEAEDLVQETYLHAFRSIATFRPTENGIRPWLFKILHNALYSRLAKDHRRREAVEQKQFESNPQAADDGTAAPLTDLASQNWEQVDGGLRRAVLELPLAQRTAFLLHVEGLRYREVADVLDVPIGTVMSRLSRAREMLTERLKSATTPDGVAEPTSERRLPPS